MNRICVMPGDGIGKEIMGEAVKYINKMCQIYNKKLDIKRAYIGGEAVDKFGNPLPDESLDIIKTSKAVLLGCVGGYKWDNIDSKIRPEQGLLRLRKELNCYANLRPINIYKELSELSPLKERILKNNIDILIVRELTGGIYFGEKGRFEEGGKIKAYDVEEYYDYEIKRICKVAFDHAKRRRKKVTLVDKANVLESSKLFREIAKEMSLKYKDIELEFMYVDNASMQIIKNPSSFDVILTNNIFGDILSDEASVITGSIGILPSASIGDINIYEPIHGSAPDIEGENIANPIGMILSTAMMLEECFDFDNAVEITKITIQELFNKNYKTIDLKSHDKNIILKTCEFGDLIINNL
ncbi:3-isopropylmalate dehydrogenase [Peptostreptococcaceae bacterium AGR-M142]